MRRLRLRSSVGTPTLRFSLRRRAWLTNELLLLLIGAATSLWYHAANAPFGVAGVGVMVDAGAVGGGVGLRLHLCSAARYQVLRGSHSSGMLPT